MATEKKRLFIGNLPEEVDEELIKSRFSKYGRVLSVEIKKRKVNGFSNMADGERDEIFSTFAFIDISPSNDLDICIRKLSRKKWSGKEIKIEYAKESALDRLQRERLEMAKSNETYNKLTKSLAEHNHLNGILKEELLRQRSKVHSLHSNDKEVPKRKSIRFEDDDDDDDGNSFERSKLKVTPHHTASVGSLSSSEQRRMKSLEEKKNLITQRKQAVKAALSSVDSSSMNIKKIIFNNGDDEGEDDSDGVVEEKECSRASKNDQLDVVVDESSLRNQRAMNDLFEDTDDDSEKESDIDFQIKQQFEGKKGQKLLQLQSRFGNDSRFTLDRRFAAESSGDGDDEDEGKNEKKRKRRDIDEVNKELDEVSRQLEILSGVVGRQIIKRPPSQLNARSKKKSPNNFGEQREELLGVRYDPTKAAHSRFVVKPPLPGSEAESAQDKKSKKVENYEEEEEEEEESMEGVGEDAGGERVGASKETYYEVANDLKERLQSSGSFSLSQLFSSGADKKLSSGAAQALPKEKVPVRADRSAPRAKFCSIWKEAFFFRVNDCRFKEAIEFLRSKEQVAEKMNEFAGKRRELKCIVKRKIQSERWLGRSFKKKLGGGSTKGKGFKKNHGKGSTRGNKRRV